MQLQMQGLKFHLNLGHKSKLWLSYSLFFCNFVIFVAFNYQNCLEFARLHKFNTTHYRVVFEFSCLGNEFEIPFHNVVSHFAFTIDYHTCFQAAKMKLVAFLNCIHLFG